MKIDLSMTADELRKISDADLAEGIAAVQRLAMDNAQEHVNMEKQQAAIRRIRRSIAGCTDLAPLTPTMQTSSDQLLEDYRELTAKMGENRWTYKMLKHMRGRWLAEETKRREQAWYSQLEADLIDPSVTPVHTCHCCCH